MRTHQTTQDETNLTIIERLRRRTTYVPPVEARELLNTTKETLCGWVREGKFKGAVIRVGNRNMFEPKGLADWLEARKN